MSFEKRVKKVVLAYSGGLDTSVTLKWLIEECECDVITFSADIGQFDCKNISKIKLSAIKNGARKACVHDLRDEFISNFVFPMFRANALYESQYLLGTAISRPIIAKKQMELAMKEEADIVAHGALGKGNESLRFEMVYFAINPGIKVLSPWQNWNLTSRRDLVDFAHKYGMKVPVSKENPYSIDSNILHTSYEGGLLEDPWESPNEDMFLMTNSLLNAPDYPEEIKLGFEDGNPISLNGKKMKPVELFFTLNAIGGGHGIGRIDMVENRLIGVKSRGVYETPGGTIIRKAHIDLESIILDKEELKLRDSLIPKYSALVYDGLWFSPERYALQTLMDKIQEKISGEVKLKLYKGNCVVDGRKSENSTYKSVYDWYKKNDITIYEISENYLKASSDKFRLKQAEF